MENKRYPLRMVKGNAGTPQRFWDKRIVFNVQEEAESDTDGYVISADQTNLENP